MSFQDNAYHIDSSPSVVTSLSAEVQLPQGANITRITFHVLKSTSSGDIQLHLRKNECTNAVSGPFTRTVATLSTSDITPGSYLHYTDEIIATERIINNNDGYYYVNLFMPATDGLVFNCGWIEYEYTE